MKSAFSVIFLFVFVLLTVGCTSKADRVVQRQKEEHLVETKTQLGAGYLLRGQYDVANELMKSALEIDPNNSNANNVMGLLQWRIKYYEQAEKFFKKAVRDSKNSEAQNNYGAFLCERGEIDKAVGRFEMAVANHFYKTPEQAYMNAGVCLMKKPVPEKAENYFRAALKIDSKLPTALYHMAKITYDSGNGISARGFIQRYFEVGKDTPESLLLAVKIERTLRNKDAEASYALRLRGKFPTSPELEELQKLLRKKHY